MSRGRPKSPLSLKERKRLASQRYYHRHHEARKTASRLYRQKKAIEDPLWREQQRKNWKAFKIRRKWGFLWGEPPVLLPEQAAWEAGASILGTFTPK